MFYKYIYINLYNNLYKVKMTKLEDLTLEEFRERFIKKRVIINKSVKKHYQKYYMKDEPNLTDEQKKIQEERIQKRRQYMNDRYKKIYKPKREKQKEQTDA